MKQPYLRTILVILALALVTGIQIRAEFDPSLIGKGFKGGLNIANVGNHKDRTDSRTGYLLGALANYPMVRNIDFQIELLVTEKGYKVPDTLVVDTAGNPIDTAEWTAMVTYIEIPVTVRLTLPIRSKIRPYLNLGGFAAQAIIKKERRAVTAYTLDLDLENVKNTDVGFLAGLGLDIKSGGGKVFLEVRYDYSNVSLLKFTKYRSRVWSFQAGYWW